MSERSSSKEVIIKSLKNRKDIKDITISGLSLESRPIEDNILFFPVCLNIDTEKSSKIYTSLCSLRNMLIENSIISKDLRYNMHFYNDKNERIKE